MNKLLKEIKLHLIFTFKQPADHSSSVYIFVDKLETVALISLLTK